MAGYIYVLLAAFCVAVSAAPPAQQRMYSQQAPAQLQPEVNPLDYYLDHQGVDNYYRPAEQSQVSVNGPKAESGRLESLEPDSEVELVPGVQQPQQPPQQNPVAPNVPGLLPGQRVFIVHMPVPGYRPGSIGGYQPVYIVAAGAQGNPGFPGNGINGYQNAVLLDPSGQAVVSPVIGYGSRGIVPPQLLGAPFALQRPYDLVYQDAGVANPVEQGRQGNAGEAIRFSNVVGFQGPVPLGYQGPVVAVQAPVPNKNGANAAPAKLKQSEETKESVEQKPTHRGAALLRNKA